MKTQLQNTLHELDHTMGSIGLRVRSLNDIQTLFGQLNDSMEEAAHSGEPRVYFETHFREVRVLSDLMFFTMKELSKEFEQVEKLKETLFDEAVRNNQPPKEKAHTTGNSESSNKRH